MLGGILFLSFGVFFFDCFENLEFDLSPPSAFDRFNCGFFSPLFMNCDESIDLFHDIFPFLVKFCVYRVSLDLS